MSAVREFAAREVAECSRSTPPPPSFPLSGRRNENHTELDAKPVPPAPTACPASIQPSTAMNPLQLHLAFRSAQLRDPRDPPPPPSAALNPRVRHDTE